GERRLQLSEDCAVPAAPVPDRFQSGLQSDRFVIIPGRAVILPFALVREGAIGESAGVTGLDLDQPIEILERAVVFALLLVREAAVVESVRIFRTDLERLVVVLNGAVVFLPDRIGIAAIVMGDGQGC